MIKSISAQVRRHLRSRRPTGYEDPQCLVLISLDFFIHERRCSAARRPTRDDEWRVITAIMRLGYSEETAALAAREALGRFYETVVYPHQRSAMALDERSESRGA